MAIRLYVFYMLILIYCSVRSGRTTSDVENTKSKRNYNRWTEEMEKKLLFFDVLTDDGEGNQLERIKALWRGAYPEFQVTDKALYGKLYKLRQESQEEGEYKKYFKWNHKRRTELLDVYHTTKPYKAGAERTLEEEWKRRYEDCQISGRSLFTRAWRILKERGKKPEYVVEGTSNMDLQWNNRHDSDLMHAYNVARLEGGAHWRNTLTILTDLHPQYRHFTLEELRDRVSHLRNNPPNENFPWTEEENKELLDIYDKTMPDKEDQGRRIYDIWSKIHPRYKFMSPFYLQIHASTLAHKREKAASGSAKRQWNHEEKADLVTSYRRHQGEPPRNFGFLKEWVRKHPRLAYLPNVYLKEYARQMEDKEFNDTSKKLRKESPRRKENKYSQQKKSARNREYGQTSSEDRGHSNQSTKGYNSEHEANICMRFGSMKRIMEKSEHRSGKAKVVYYSDEQESSPSNMSEDSE